MTVLPHQFRDPALLELALTHSSMESPADNERLEFLGDAALDLVVAEELFRHHPDLAEGDLTELKAWVVSRKTLAEAARKLALESAARVGRGLSNRTLSRSVLANLYEAVLGAVYLDGGLESARAFVMTTLADPLADVREQRCGVNSKQALQELSQKHWGTPPEYVELESRGRAHARAFLVCAEIRIGGADDRDGGRSDRFPPAWGRTRKEAEQWAAYEALLVLEGQEPA